MPATLLFGVDVSFMRSYLPLPSTYMPYICPWQVEGIDQLAEEGKFPTLIDLLPALHYFAILSVTRLLLQKIVFKVAIF